MSAGPVITAVSPPGKSRAVVEPSLRRVAPPDPTWAVMLPG